MTSTLATAWNQQAPFQTALDALERFQWSVFPLDEDKRPPQTGGTYPDGTPKRLAWKHLQTRLPSLKEVRFWQRIYTPGTWAVITGAICRLIVLDFDGEAGRQLCQRLGLKPHVQTGSAGFHVYFLHPGWSVPTLNGKSEQALGERWPGLDIRGDGGYAAFCGCNSHGPYIWLRDPVPDELSTLPEDLRTVLGLLHSPGLARQGHELLLQALQQSKSGRNDAGWLACQLRDKGYDQKDQQEQGFAIGRPTNPPRDVAEQILARQTQPPYLPFPELVGLVETPILRPDGSICGQPGYDPQTRLYYAPPPDSESCCIPSHPTSRDVDEALAFIWDTFGEFPYASQADRANTLGLLMTPLIRPIIRHCIPISLLDAPKKGVGKTMLVILMSIIATGRPVALMPVPSNEEEWEKRVYVWPVR